MPKANMDDKLVAMSVLSDRVQKMDLDQLRSTMMLIMLASLMGDKVPSSFIQDYINHNGRPQ